MKKSTRSSRSPAGEPPAPKKRARPARAREATLHTPFEGSEARAVEAMLEEVFGPAGREEPAGRGVAALKEPPPLEAAWASNGQKRQAE